MSDNHLAFDLEMDQPGKEIIQVGAVIVDLDTHAIVAEKTWYIKIPHALNPMIVQLCGITDHHLEAHGTTLEIMYEELKAFHAGRGCAVNPITWGGGDHRALRQALGIGEDDPFLFGHRELDAKTVFQTWRKSQHQSVQGGLARSMTKLGLAFQGRKHNALDDARNTARMYCALLRKMRA